MSSKKNTPKRDLKSYDNQENNILGIKAFILKLEKDFFCDVKIANSNSSLLAHDLILEAKFNFNLTQGLSLLANRKIGDLDLDIDGKKECLFLTALDTLSGNNQETVDIEELNLIFNDCTLIIHRIFENSICLQLGHLIKELHNSQIYYTRAFTNTPYEIHIPVFEERTFDVDYSILNSRTNANKIEDYFAFWGLYFDDNVDPYIYDFNNRDIIDGELTMINQ